MNKDFVSYIAKCAKYDPVTVEETLLPPNVQKWEDAIKREYESLIEKETWCLVKLPPDRRAIHYNGYLKQNVM